MKKYLYSTVLAIIWSLTLIGQENVRKLEFSINYGAAGGFGLNYEQPVDQVPSGFVRFANKNFFGTIGGAEIVLNMKSGKSALGLSYDRQLNVGRKDYGEFINGSTFIRISDFKLRHINEFFSFFYRRKVGRNLFLTGGTYFIFPQMQEIEHFAAGNINGTAINGHMITIQDRNVENSNIMDAGFFVGAEYYFYSSGNFQVGIQSRLYHTSSIGSFEAITLTPKLRFTF